MSDSELLSAWAIATNQSQKAFGVTLGGEFSTAINDCGLWFVIGPFVESDVMFTLTCYRLNGIGGTAGYPDCTPWDNWSVSLVSLVTCELWRS